MTGLYLILAGGIIMTGGDMVMKLWTKGKGTLLFPLGLAIYLLAMVFLAYSYKFKNIAIGSSMLVTINIVSLTLISWFYFKEKLTPLQIFGLFLAVVSVTLLEFGKTA